MSSVGQLHLLITQGFNYPSLLQIFQRFIIIDMILPDCRIYWEWYIFISFHLWFNEFNRQDIKWIGSCGNSIFYSYYRRGNFTNKNHHLCMCLFFGLSMYMSLSIFSITASQKKRYTPNDMRNGFILIGQNLSKIYYLSYEPLVWL